MAGGRLVGRGLFVLAFGLASLMPVGGEVAFGQSDGQRPPPETRKGNVMRKAAFAAIGPVQELLVAGKNREALAAIKQIDTSKFNPYEKAKLVQFEGYAYSGLEQYKNAIRSFEQALAIPEGLGPAEQRDLKFNLAQLHRATDNLDRSLQLFEEWLALTEAPTGSQYFQISSTYAQAEKYGKALPLAEKSVASEPQPPQNWLRLLVQLYLQQKSYAKAAPHLEDLATRFPSASYWKQLASVYAELNRDKKSLVALELAYEQGFLESNTDLRRLAEMYVFQEIPHKAALLLSKEIEAGRMEKNERNWELLATAWYQAREFDKAVPAFENAGKLAKTGENFMTAGQIHYNAGRWDECVDAIDRALDKGGLKNEGQAFIVRGLAKMYQKKRQAAIADFKRAQRYDNTRKAGAQWIKVIEAQIANDALAAG